MSNRIALQESCRKLQREMAYSTLNARQLEEEKINRMVGGKREMKQMMQPFKDKNRR